MPSTMLSTEECIIESQRNHELRMEYLRKYTDKVSKRAELRFQRKKSKKQVILQSGLILKC